MLKTKTLCFDLDGTLCTNTFGDYESAEPFPWAIARVNALAAAGHRIVVFTARGTATGIDWTDTTREQLARWGVAYDDLRLGKPSADVYVDDRAVHTDAWRTSHVAVAPGFFGAPPAEGAEDLPAGPPSQVGTLVEVGRTFGGRPLLPARHAERLARRASAAGFPNVPSAAAVESAIESALAEAGDAGELVFALSLVEPAGWDQLHLAANGAPSPGLHVSCRPLAESAATLVPLLANGGPGVRATTAADASAWPLRTDGAGGLTDALGGELAAGRGGALVLPAASDWPPVAREWALEAAAAAGIAVAEGPVTGEEEELLLIGLPFGVLPVAELDGRNIGAVPGPVAGLLTEALAASAEDRRGG